MIGLLKNSDEIPEKKSVKSILVFRSGLLGDTLAAVPALWCLRQAYPQAHFTYIWQNINSSSHVKAEDVLMGSGLIDSFDYYETHVPKWRRVKSAAGLLWRLRKTSWDVAIVLEEPHWSSARIWLARLCQPKILIAPRGRVDRLPRTGSGQLKKLPHIADTLLQVLKPLKMNLPREHAGRCDINLQAEDHGRVETWLNRVGALQTPRPWIGIGPWSNMPVKRWPLDRYREVVSQLIKEFNVTPFILGGKDERKLGEDLVAEWGRGYVACGALTIREGVSLLSRCSLYLGNDTGVMHMAAAAGIPCVAVFCSHEAPGRWEPYGKGHQVFRTPIACEGCLLRDCIERKMECILSIEPRQVFEACRQKLLGSPIHQLS